MNILLMMMGGSGTRFGADIPKQYILVNGCPIFSYILEGYQNCDFIDMMVVVTHKDWTDYVEEWKDKLNLDKLKIITNGGGTRSESVLNGLRSLEGTASEKDVILIHDATHPYVDVEGTKKIIEAVKKYGGATLGQCQYDTVYQMNEETNMLEKVIPRQQIVSGASPEAFFYGDIHRIYTESTMEELEQMTSAGAIALAHDIRMQVIPAEVLNLKITYKKDMDVFLQMIHQYFPGKSGK
ncbi:MAG: 2-C-methyl-D-erythritol 4-phosphate cytidylyltransferase [Eubacterium sp.]|nr:2-C-methyl-D-erythritol 4-phosphate cytidylyltransferase [Eubacterium sp.]